jgi:uncharacterized membrane protein
VSAADLAGDDMTIVMARLAVAAIFADAACMLATRGGAPAWIPDTELYVMCGAVLLAVIVVVVAVIQTRAYRPAVREVPASNGIQVLDTVLRSGEDGDR